MSTVQQQQQVATVTPSNFQEPNRLNSRSSSGARKRSVANRSAISNPVQSGNNSLRGMASGISSINESLTKNSGGNKWNRNGYGQAIEPTIGKFSAEESNTVKTAVERYCSTHGVTTARLCSESDNRTDHLRGAWMDIAKELPHRTVQSVYRHGLRLMHPFKRGAWDEKETNELLLLVTTHGKKWSEIQNKLNRSADSCRDKYREFHTNFTKGKWKVRESKELEMHVRKVLEVGDDVPLADLGKLVEHESVNVPWSTISEKMKNRSRLSCFKRFQQITGMKKTSGKKRKKMEDDEDGDVSASAMQNSTTNTYREQNAAGNSNSNTDDRDLTTSTRGALRGVSGSATVPSRATAPIPLTTANPIQPSLPVHPSVPPIPDPTAVAVCSCETDDVSSVDRQLLLSLASSTYERETDVAWGTIHHPLGNPQERWNLILDKWIETNGMDEDVVFDRPIWEVAKEILSQDVDDVVAENQAEMAARTVEAVFLC
jgi:hypothetical protein